MRQITTTLFGLFIIISNAAAGDKTLNASQIQELISGNTAIGRWVDHHYRQYFDQNGTTIYAQ